MTSRPRVDLADAVALLGACAAPSEAFWRLVELDAVRRSLADPGASVLELGCGDGIFTELAGIRVDLGIDREPRAVERARRRKVYARTLVLDIHDLGPEHGRFGTVFANSVLEHVPRLEATFPGIAAALLPGGRLVTTVPLSEMNRCLAVRGHWYVGWRQRQLQHRNLWSKAQWERALHGAGFTDVQWTDYLPGEACRFWDRYDVLGALGSGRYRIAPALHHATSRLLPGPAREAAKRTLGRVLLDRMSRLVAGPPCAAVLTAVVAT